MSTILNVVLVVPAYDDAAVQEVNRLMGHVHGERPPLVMLDASNCGGTKVAELAVWMGALNGVSRVTVEEAVREAPWEDAESVTLVLDNGDLGYCVCTTAGELRRGGRDETPARQTARLTLHEYHQSQEIRRTLARAGVDISDDFYALVALLMRQADATNLPLLRAAFPHVYADLRARYETPGGVLPDDPQPA